MNVERREINCDILIIGGGSSGLWAARSAKLKHPEQEILVVDKANTDWGGLMSLSGGDLEVCMPPERPEDWVKDFVYYWDGLCEQDVVEKIWEQSFEIFREYEKMGCRYLKNEEGEYRSVLQRNLGHIRLFPVQVKGTGGTDMRNCMIAEMKRLGIRRMGRIEITELLKSENEICGALGFHIVEGVPILFRAKTVILCTGNMGWKPSYNNNTTCGEGQRLAFRAGASLRNCEFIHIWNVPKLFEWEGQTVLMPLGAKFVNSEGENFMEKYSPKLGANTDPHYITRGMALEIKAGRGPIRLDLHDIPESARAIVKPAAGRHLLHYEKLLAEGIDFFRDQFEWITQVQLANGAIVTDQTGRTGIPGLYAAGRCRSIDPGVYMGGFALMTTAVTGKQAGEDASDYAAQREHREVDEAYVETAIQKMFEPLGKQGIAPKEVLRKLQELISHYDVSILKSGDALWHAGKQLKQIKEEYIPQMAAADTHYLSKLEEVKAIADATDFYLKAALFRTDSRAGHYRVDFPEHYDDWMCWVELRNENGCIVPKKVPVPVEKYKYPVERYYADNFEYVVCTTQRE